MDLGQLQVWLCNAVGPAYKVYNNVVMKEFRAY
jgi:hypothetical protein